MRVSFEVSARDAIVRLYADNHYYYIHFDEEGELHRSLGISQYQPYPIQGTHIHLTSDHEE